MNTVLMSAFAVLVLSCCFSALKADFVYVPIVAEVPVSCVQSGFEDKVNYEFALEATDATFPVPKTNRLMIEGSGSGKFEITVEEPGTYTYKVYQMTGQNGDIIYDDTIFYVTLFVTGNDENNLELKIANAIEGKAKPTKLEFVNTLGINRNESLQIADTGERIGDEWIGAVILICLSCGSILLVYINSRRMENV